MMERGLGEITENLTDNLFRAAKEKKFWQTIYAYALRGHGTYKRNISRMRKVSAVLEHVIRQSP